MMNEKEYRECIGNMRRRTVRLDREGDYWTEEGQNLLKDMFNDNAGITEIAICLQRTESAIMQQIEQMDLYERKRHPMRNKPVPKAPVCLCDGCKLDKSFCPRCEVYNVPQEV